MSTLAERVASLVLAKFETLPAKSKPRVYEDGSREWIPMSGIVLVSDANTEKERLECVCLATGSKCLPRSTIAKCNGLVLHDSHSEVLALRALNRFLLLEVKASLSGKEPQCRSSFVRHRASDMPGTQQHGEQYPHPFELVPGVSIHMFSTEAPCGDASMEILMSQMDGNVAPWDVSTETHDALQGRGYFSALGIVRRKPSRNDAERTMSKSCTDKLALKQVMSLLSFPTCFIIAPTPSAYLAELVVPYDKFAEAGFARSFGTSGRLAMIDQMNLPSSLRFRPFHPTALSREFKDFSYSKPKQGHIQAKIGNVSALYISEVPGVRGAVYETLVGGVKQGWSQLSIDTRKSSEICRWSLCMLLLSIVDLISSNSGATPRLHEALAKIKDVTTYGSMKEISPFQDRRMAKHIVTEILRGWRSNDGDEKWNPSKDSGSVLADQQFASTPRIG